MPSLEQARTLGQSAAFQSGKAALAIDGDWTIGTYSATKGIKVGYSPQPAGPKGSWSMYNGLADAIWVGTKHKPEATKWVQLPGEPGLPEHRRLRGRRVPGDQVRGPEGRGQAQGRRHRRERVHVLHRVRQHGALPDHRQGAADQPDRAADAGGVPQRQRGRREGVQEHERRRSTTSSSTRPSDLLPRPPAVAPTSPRSPPPLAALSRDPFARAHGRAALRFQLSLAVYFAAIVGDHARCSPAPSSACSSCRSCCS